MPVYRLPEENIFPSPKLANENGLLAIGGDLSVPRLLRAYSMGIFPWYSEGYPILWWSPDPRLILLPDELKVSRSLRQVISKGQFIVTLDKAFRQVITSCAQIKRKHEKGTWINADIIEAYTKLHELGFAHSVESWHNSVLVGGLYGVSLGSAFFGESMFAKISNASKVAFVQLVDFLKTWKVNLIDCQITTTHLMNFGAKEVPRTIFLKMLKQSLTTPTRKGKWSMDNYPGGEKSFIINHAL